MKNENELLLELVSYSLSIDKNEERFKSLDTKLAGVNNEGWNNLMESAVNHGVLSLICDTIESLSCASSIIKKRVLEYSRKVCLNNYKLFVYTRNLLNLFEKRGIKACVLKGIATAGLYKMPELRKMSDIDIYLCENDGLNQATKLLEENGFVKDEQQWTLHHVVMSGPNNVVVELHNMLVEPFEDNKTNKVVEDLTTDISDSIVSSEVMGITFSSLKEPYHAFELLMHMIQHFVNKGFGLKLLCDWVMFWNRDIDKKDIDDYVELVNKMKVERFSRVLTYACVKYLNLDETKVSWMKLNDDSLAADAEAMVEDVMEADEYGHSEKKRVATVKGHGFWAYFKEFHYQTKRNFPKLGKIFIFWPFLWIISFVRFQRNNRKVRGVTLRSVLKEAGKRSELVDNMKLFKDKE